MDDAYSNYERCLIATIFEYAAKKYKTQIQFARDLWPGKSDANVNTKIRAIRERNSRGKPQGLKISDVAKMADVLKIPLSSLALEVETKLRLGWAEVAGEELASMIAEKNVHQETKRKTPQPQTVGDYS